MAASGTTTRCAMHSWAPTQDMTASTIMPRPPSLLISSMRSTRRTNCQKPSSTVSILMTIRRWGQSLAAFRTPRHAPKSSRAAHGGSTITRQACRTRWSRLQILEISPASWACWQIREVFSPTPDMSISGVSCAIWLETGSRMESFRLTWKFLRRS